MITISTNQKTQAELDYLKANWTADPIWDIECTEGYEAHWAELRVYRAEMEQEWKVQLEARQMKKSVALGVPGNLTLAAYIMRLEQRIAELEERIAK